MFWINDLNIPLKMSLGLRTKLDFKLQSDFRREVIENLNSDPKENAMNVNKISRWSTIAAKYGTSEGDFKGKVGLDVNLRFDANVGKV